MITPLDYSRATRRVEFEFENDLAYSPGDILVVHPSNDSDLCRKLAERLNLQLTDVLRIERRDRSSSSSSSTRGLFPHLISVLELFSDFLAISSPPTKYFFKVMSSFASNELHKEKLAEISSKEGNEEYYNYAVRERRNVYEILFDFDSVALPLEYLLDAISW